MHQEACAAAPGRHPLTHHTARRARRPRLLTHPGHPVPCALPARRPHPLRRARRRTFPWLRPLSRATRRAGRPTPKGGLAARPRCRRRPSTTSSPAPKPSSTSPRCGAGWRSGRMQPSMQPASQPLPPPPWPWGFCPRREGALLHWHMRALAPPPPGSSLSLAPAPGTHAGGTVNRVCSSTKQCDADGLAPLAWRCT